MQRLHPRIVLALHHPEHLITLTMQELRQMLTILASDTGDKRSGHKAGESTAFADGPAATLPHRMTVDR
jgi:hypothetical protein